ncbi:hypothetical protein [uncultured Desulfovibrio sp.]|uniref:hypothetical protein n=1 Tax=uncultured Desulfovibrio sp. TaxID=167968 RepID=UPI0020515568|nr:hypothetical protein [uncultured Desulfovibrio sp.]DAV75463.1 MAG TPA: hypothetical protein [Caudoviricetes sp.]
MKKAIFTRKPTDLSEVRNPYIRNETAEPYTIEETITLTPLEYDRLGRNLLDSNPAFSGKGGATPDGITKCIAVKAEGRKTLLVNPEGYDYARMVAFA